MYLLIKILFELFCRAAARVQQVLVIVKIDINIVMLFNEHNVFGFVVADRGRRKTARKF